MSNVDLINSALDNNVKAYADNTRLLASYIADAILAISPKISTQIVVFNAGDCANFYGVAETIKNCVDPIGFKELIDSPFFLGYKSESGEHYIHIKRQCIEQKRLIEELYRLTAFGLDMGGIKPEYMQ